MSATSIADILNQTQKTFACHRKAIKVLRKIQRRDPGSFIEEFTPYLKRILVIFKREPSVERLVQFIIAFCTSNEGDKQDEQSEMDAFAMFMLSFLVELTGVKDKAVRFRATQIIAGILNGMSPESALDDDLWQRLMDKLLVRTRDKIPIIRVQAVHALCRLQDPSFGEDMVTQTYLRLLSFDSSFDVRKAVLSNIGLSKVTLPDILKRTRDIKDDVRKHAYFVLGKRVNFKVFSISQRITLIKDGLADRSAKVREACVDMVVNGWLSSIGGDFTKLLSGLDIEEYGDEIADLLKQIIPSLNAAPQLDYENLTSESAFYWRLYCTCLKEQNKELDDVLPEISKICQMLRHYEEQEYILKQLLLICKLLDFTDEAGRRNLYSVLRETIPKLHLPNETALIALGVLNQVQPSEDEFLRVCFELISDLNDSLQELADKMQDEGAQEELDKKIKELTLLKKKFAKKEQFEEAKRIKEELEVLEEQRNKMKEEAELQYLFAEQAWLRCLCITQTILDLSTKSLNDPGIRGLLDSVILMAVQHSIPPIRNAAIKCLGLYCLKDPSEAKKHLFLLLQVLQNDKPNIRATTLQALFDIILLFGTKFIESVDKPVKSPKPEAPVAPDDELSDIGDANGSQEGHEAPEVDEEVPSAATILSKMEEHLFDDDSTLRTLAVEGFAKLLLHNVHSDVKTLSKLLLLFFCEATAEDAKLRQCLSLFFPAFAFSSFKHQKLVAEAFIPTLRKIMRAKPRSPFKDIPVADVAQFMIYLTDSSNLQNESNQVSPKAKEMDKADRNLHAALAVDISNEILVNPTGTECKSLYKFLNSLNITKDDQEEIKTLLVLVGTMQEDVKDKNALKSIAKFKQTLVSLEDTSKGELSADKLESIRQKTQQQREDKAEDTKQSNGRAVKRKRKSEVVESKLMKKKKSKKTRRDSSSEEEVEEEPADASEEDDDIDALLGSEDEEDDYDSGDESDEDMDTDDKKKTRERDNVIVKKDVKTMNVKKPSVNVTETKMEEAEEEEEDSVQPMNIEEEEKPKTTEKKKVTSSVKSVNKESAASKVASKKSVTKTGEDTSKLKSKKVEDVKPKPKETVKVETKAAVTNVTKKSVESKKSIEPKKSIESRQSVESQKQVESQKSTVEMKKQTEAKTITKTNGLEKTAVQRGGKERPSILQKNPEEVKKKEPVVKKTSTSSAKPNNSSKTESDSSNKKTVTKKPPVPRLGHRSTSNTVDNKENVQNVRVTKEVKKSTLVSTKSENGTTKKKSNEEIRSKEKQAEQEKLMQELDELLETPAPTKTFNRIHKIKERLHLEREIDDLLDD